MNFFLKIVRERRSGAIRKCDGHSGKRYNFSWNNAVNAYSYQPANQAEVDDLFANKGTWLRFAPVDKAPVTDAPEPVEPPPIPPLVIPAADFDPLSPETTEQCIARGVIVSEDDSNEYAQRLIVAYDKGAVDTLARIGTSNAKPRRKKSEPAEAPDEQL